MTLTMRRGLAAAILLVWAFAVHQDAILLLQAAVTVLRTAIVLVVTGAAAWAAIYVVGHPEILRNATAQARNILRRR